MNTTKRLLCLLLVLTMLVGMFAGCNDNSNTNDPKDTDEETTAKDDGNNDATKGDDDATTAGDDVTTGGDVTEDPRKADTLEPSYDFGGVQEFVVLSRSSTTYEFESAKGANLSGVEQAIYDRNSATEERCKVEITVVPLAGDWGNLETFTAALRANNSLSTGEYDLVATHQAYLASAVLEGYSWDFDKLPNIDLSKIWWSEAYY